MEAVSVVRRAGRVALAMLLAAVLAVLGVSVPAPASGVAAGVPDAGVGAGGAPVDALAPTWAVGRPVAEPSVARLHGQSDGGPFGTVPPGVNRADLVLADEQPAAGTAVAGTAVLRGSAGVRGPPHTLPVRGATF
jgi:hypothetical protein